MSGTGGATPSIVGSTAPGASGPMQNRNDDSSAKAALYGSMATGAISSIGTGFSQSNAIRAAGKYRASLARTNQALAGLAGEETVQAGDIAAGNKNLETQQKVGSERAAAGASGVNVDSGSAALVRGATNLVGATDELTIRNNAARAAFGYKIKGIEDEGTFAELTAKSESEQTLLSGGLQAVGGPLSTYANYLRYSQRYAGGNGQVPDSYVP